MCVAFKYLLWLGIFTFPGSSAGKESVCNAGNLGSIPGLGRAPGGESGNPLQDSCLENPHGQRSLAGQVAESDTTERLSAVQLRNYSEKKKKKKRIRNHHY